MAVSGAIMVLYSIRNCVTEITQLRRPAADSRPEEGFKHPLERGADYDSGALQTEREGGRRDRRHDRPGRSDGLRAGRGRRRHRRGLPPGPPPETGAVRAPGPQVAGRSGRPREHRPRERDRAAGGRGLRPHRHPGEQRRHHPAHTGRSTSRKRTGTRSWTSTSRPCSSCPRPWRASSSSRGRAARSSTSPPCSRSRAGSACPPTPRARAAVMGLTRLLANEWAPHGINVNAIAPGYMATDNTAGAPGRPGPQPPDPRAHPRRPLGEPRRPEGGRGVPGLRRLRYLQGHTLAVDGGWLAR